MVLVGLAVFVDVEVAVEVVVKVAVEVEVGLSVAEGGGGADGCDVSVGEGVRAEGIAQPVRGNKQITIAIDTLFFMPVSIIEF